MSSFGISGTNAHVILEEPPPLEPRAATVGGEAPCLALPIVLSARSEGALRGQAARLRAHLEAHHELALPDVAHGLVSRRSSFEHRAAVVAPDRSSLLDALASLSTGGTTEQVVRAEASLSGKLVFVFPGQGAQWAQMARGLLETSDVFRRHIELCARALAPLVDWSLLSVLRGEPGAPSIELRLDVMQPALFSVMVSLAALWRSLGVEPDAVIGHSQGELAAACVAGALSLDDALKVVALRSRMLTRLIGTGATIAVELPAADLAARLERFGERLSIAAFNGPRSHVVAGDPEAVDALVGELEAAAIFVRRVRTFDVASHNAQMDIFETELLEALADLAPRPAAVPLYSTVNVERLTGAEMDAAYWFRNMRRPVRFADAVQKLLQDGHRFFVEVSPHPVLGLALHGISRGGRRADGGGGDAAARSGRLGTVRAVRGRAAGPGRFGRLEEGRADRASRWSCRPMRSSGSGTGSMRRSGTRRRRRGIRSWRRR